MSDLGYLGYGIDSYISHFSGGIKQFLFAVVFDFPISLSGMFTGITKTDLTYHVKASVLPESTFEDASIPYPGYVFKMATQRSYADWTVSLIVDRDTKIIDLFQAWHNLIYNPETHSYSPPSTYMRNQTLIMLDNDMNAVAEYQLRGAWPRSIGNVGFDYASTEIATVDITFAYQYYISKNQSNPAGV